jgi:hypothetical protein
MGCASCMGCMGKLAFATTSHHGVTAQTRCIERGHPVHVCSRVPYAWPTSIACMYRFRCCNMCTVGDRRTCVCCFPLPFSAWLLGRGRQPPHGLTCCYCLRQGPRRQTLPPCPRTRALSSCKEVTSCPGGVRPIPYNIYLHPRCHDWLQDGKSNGMTRFHADPCS